MKILFVWTGVTSYMADCWRELSSRPGVELKVVVEAAPSGRHFDAAQILSGLDYELVGRDASWQAGPLAAAFSPDVVFAGGWRSPTTRKVLAAYPRAFKVFCLDMPWRWRPRCLIARWALRGFLRQFSACWVPGKLAYRYARWLGFSKSRVWRRLYAVDRARLAAGATGTSSRRGFFFAGRHDPEKRVDLIRRAYARYRELGGQWAVDYYGGANFLQPEAMRKVFREKACLLLASSFDPWPLVVLEAKAAGCSAIASDRCGNADELGAIKVPYGDVEAMARAMVEVESGARGPDACDLSGYDVGAWADRCLEIANGRSYWCPGLHDAANGMAVVARMMAAETGRPDNVFVVHGAWSVRGWWECLRRVVGGKGELVRMPHGSYSPVYLERQGKWKKRLAGPVERWTLRRAAKVIATCEAEARWIRAYEPRVRKVEVTDLRRFFRLDAAAAAAAPARHVLYLGRRHPLKGIEYLEKAAAQVPEVELRIVSDHRGAELEADWAWCDVLALPTLSDNFGLVVAEALARGKRVIVTDGAPAWEPAGGADDGYGGRLRYVRGYLAADDVRRVELLRAELRKGACRWR